MSAPPRSTRKTPRQATSLVAYDPAPEPEAEDPLLQFAPYRHPCPRRNSITPDKQRMFIATLAASGIVSQAARRIGKSLEALYKLRHRPGAEDFAAAWDAAAERGLTRLEDCALELAIAGEELPIVSAGKLLGTYRKHNFGHIRFVLSQRRAARWAAEGAATARLVPGHPVYERLKREWEHAQAEEAAANSEAIVQELNARFERILERRKSAQELAGADEDGEED
ncbi:hypothetical protein ACFFF7_00800 [Novosphingobium aquiterrae]|uniref:Helix-turn-helix domain-containing protein n=1 Tax=Novosphingobium aquiterrae TaxID=624388 RepID=A0ABV6PDP4_9SPHN